MDELLIFNYQRDGVITLRVRRRAGAAEFWKSLFFVGQLTEGTPRNPEGEVFQIHTAEKSAQGSRLAVRTGIRHR